MAKQQNPVQARSHCKGAAKMWGKGRGQELSDTFFPKDNAEIKNWPGPPLLEASVAAHTACCSPAQGPVLPEPEGGHIPVASHLPDSHPQAKCAEAK